MTDKIIMCPTVKRAEQEWQKYCKTLEPIIKSTRKFPFTSVLVNGCKILFRGETEGQSAIWGYHADIHIIDEFVDEKFLETIGKVGMQP